MMSCKLSLVSLLVGSAVAQNPNATWATCCGPADAQCIQWTTFVISPIAPNPGDTLYVNATGVVPSPVLNSSLSVGTVNAFLYGVDVFSAPITTCGETQIDIMDITTGVLDALACPTTAGESVKLGFVLPIPQEAGGLGQLNITLNSTDQSGNLITFCVDMVATFN